MTPSYLDRRERRLRELGYQDAKALHDVLL